MAYRWDTPANVWLEDEHSGRFELAASEGSRRPYGALEAHGRLPDIARLLGASTPLACRCSPIYPEGFAFCPRCGQALARSASTSARGDWWGPAFDALLPRHVPHGLPVTSLDLGQGLENRPASPVIGRADCTLPAPPNADCVFAAAHFGYAAQCLLALATSRNVLQYWDPHALTWQLLAPEDGVQEHSLAFTRSAHAWLPAIHGRRGEVGIVPLAHGLGRLWVNPVDESYRIETLLDLPLVSAPGTLRQHLACLCVADGQVVLWSARSDLSQPQWQSVQSASGSELASPGPELGRPSWAPPAPGSWQPLDDLADIAPSPASVPPNGWSRPLSYDGRLFWLHAQGQLQWQPGLAPIWLEWPPGWSARLELGGPVQSRDGRLWQLGHDGQAYSFAELGCASPELQAIDGARPGFAGLLFRRGHAVLNQPWEAAHVEDQHDDDALVLPLLRAFNGNRFEASGLVLRLHQFTGRAEEALDGRPIARATIEWLGRRNLILDQVARLARPQDCLPFVYDNCLWLHHPQWNRIRGWRLEDGL